MIVISIDCNCSIGQQDKASNAEDVMFDMFKNEETELLHVGKFLAVSSISLLVNILLVNMFILVLKYFCVV
jgi:hypothetical protein